jgi:phosphohistidine swiveling domain-containing protein
MAIPKNLIIPLDSQLANLHNAGGKGANLSKLLQAGIPVPPGFIITTQAYLDFIIHNSLTSRIGQLISHFDPKDSQQLEEISSQVRGLFDTRQITPGVNNQIQAAYESLNRQSVAVRSSATAEDLPGISFAGQQDTFLNITNQDDLIEAVVASWSSLWTARAIGYRARYCIPQEQVAMAVIIQEMVPSFSSGVLFTANPLTGSRSEMVIDAIFGLGEALVSGQVEPDHYLVDADSMKVLDRKIGSKSIAMYAKESGGLSSLDNAAHDEAVLSNRQIIELCELGLQIAGLYDFPQDIEWGIVRDRIYILQSRPITTLFPLPRETSATPLRAYFSFAAVQGILDPITPLGQDSLRWLFAGGASLFDLELDYQTQPLLKMSGERLWIDITNVLRNPLGSRIIRRFISMVDPGIVNHLEKLVKDPLGGVGRGHFRLSTLPRALRFMIPFLKKVSGFARSPAGKADQVQKQSQVEISRLKEKYPSTPDTPLELQEILNLFLEIRTGFTYAVPHIMAAAGGGLVPLFLLNKMAQHLTGSNQLALEITRGLPNNVTTAMDLSLWKIAKSIRSDEEAFKLFTKSDAEELASRYAVGQLPGTAQSAINNFMETNGMRGIGEIDLGRIRWRENPTHIIKIILNYLQIDDPALAPDVIFEAGERAAEAAVSELKSIARSTFGGLLKANLIAYLAVRVRALAGLRESPKYFIIQMMGIIRQGLLDFGQQMAAGGKIDQAEDIFYLNYGELEQLDDISDRDLRVKIALRREAYQGEIFRVQVPRLLLSDGRSFYEGISSMDNQADRIIGSPVSPGMVEGHVRIVVDPTNSGLKPGEIMVCQGTDPAWTPLFLTAGGVIMEVGGMMTHGAIVAREYGIPAVVGVSQATEVLHSGQYIRLNGSSGEIYLLED